MATTTSQILKDTTSDAVILLTSTGGASDSGTKKVDASTLLGANTTVTYNQLQIQNIMWSMPSTANLTLIWAASSPVTAIVLTGNGVLKPTGSEPFTLINNAGAGVTGDINFTAANFQSTDSYSVILVVKKVGSGWTSSSY